MSLAALPQSHIGALHESTHVSACGYSSYTKWYIGVVSSVGIDSSWVKTYFGPLGNPGGQQGNTIGSHIVPAGKGWNPNAIDTSNYSDFVLGGYSGNTSGIWTGTIYELHISQGADTDDQARQKIQALSAKWGA